MNKILFVLCLILTCCSHKREVMNASLNVLPDQHEAKVNSSVEVITTARNTDLRLSSEGSFDFQPFTQPLENEVSVFVNDNRQFQTLLGIGGAITDASSEVFDKLPKPAQDQLIKAYYGDQGLNYSLLRTTIHSCDFSSESYTYVKEGDDELKSFSIDRDKKLRIPMIKKALAAGDDITTYASPWSPPAFMKSTNNMLRGGKLLPEYFGSWALYYAKFIKAYEKEGIPIWGVTVQNEPMATQTWESCIYSAEEERDFLKNHLGPTLEKEGLADKNIVVWDHNRDLITNRANTIFEDAEASKYAWGIGFHWYETWAGGTPMFDNLRRIKESFPDKNLLFTEGCNEKFSREKYQYWPNAERYGKSMINDFNNGTVGWTDWNILLDQNGGPNHVGNFCFAPIHGDVDKGELVLTPSYYYIGHFSKYIRPGAKRVSTASSRSTLMSTSFVNENGSLVTVVMNETDEPVEYFLYREKNQVKLQIPARAIQTILY